MVKITEKRRNIISLFIVFIAIFSALTYISTTPRPKEQFLQLYILGETRMAERYYPKNSSDITPNTPVKWYIGTTSLMDTPQLIVLKIKLGNSTTSSPDEKTATPTPLPTLIEYRRILQMNETWELPFIWEIVETRVKGNGLHLTIKVDDRKIESVSDGKNFRFIVELWRLDKASGEYIFGGKTGSERRVAWLQIWFNTTAIKQL